MKSVARILFSCVAATVLSRAPGAAPLAARSQSPPPQLRALGPSAVITDADCSTTKLGGSVPVSSIGEPVSGVEVATLRWITAAGSTPAYCAVDGSMAPIDPGAPPINFRVLLPAEWSHRAVQLGGSGFNGTIPNLAGNEFPIGGSSALTLGFAKYGSDSGHQGGPFGRGSAAAGSAEWTLHDEAMKNLGYLQMKKTHDAAMALIERMYGERPRFNYFTGTSQGGREALMVTERYPADYDGVVANVPIVSFSTLMLAPELIRIQEKAVANWVPPVKVNAIRGEFMRQCDALDGLVDGRINNYLACRAVFDVTEGAPYRRPWMAMHCPNDVDPAPANVGAGACLTGGQIATLEFVYSRYRFATPLAHGVRSFGMWVPNTDPAGSGLIADTRFRGQEGADAAAPMHSHLGVLGVTGFLFRNLRANPLDYVEGGPLNGRRVEISASLDAANPDLSAFARRGGKMIVTIGTNDTLASPGAQLDYYQAILDTMGQQAVDGFARLFVIPQAGHGLTGTSYSVDGEGHAIAPAPIPNNYDRFGVLIDWVEKNVAPARALTVTADRASLPLCSYPAYPRYVTGPPGAAASYTCAR